MRPCGYYAPDFQPCRLFIKEDIYEDIAKQIKIFRAIWSSLDGLSQSRFSETLSDIPIERPAAAQTRRGIQKKLMIVEVTTGYEVFEIRKDQ